ncbi:helicase-exonuclease AddAB subunit AddB [Bacillota bacterium LX-D]|nr:helicase-exonuclease AddAB subunit AddB [Bacillota bacterium LX-D]
MRLQFILGRAGTGKTHICLEELRQELRTRPEGSPLIFLVPEQATFQSEVMLAKTPGLGGMIRAQVFSFHRLAWKVMQEVGGCSRVHLDELGKRMVLRSLIEERKNDLKIFYHAADQPGFVDSLAGALSELKLYCQTPQTLDAVLNSGNLQDQGLLEEKIHDLRVLLAALEEYLAQGYLDPDDYLSLLAEKIHKSALFSGAKIWLDGFTGFTPQEYRVIEQLLLAAEKVKITFCLDDSQFTLQSKEKIEKLAKKSGVEIIPPLILPSQPLRFNQAPELAHVEKYFFSYPIKPLRVEEDVHNIRLIAAANRRGEVEGVAREIRRMCRDEGYALGEIALILRDLDPYQDLILTVFEDYELPVFIDRKKPVKYHPVAELLRSALEVVTSKWQHDPIFRYLKTDLIPLSRAEIDELENYCLAYGLRGKKWFDGKPWRYRRRCAVDEGEQPLSLQEEEKLTRINNSKNKAVRELLLFAKRLSKAKTVREITEALYYLLADLKVQSALEKWALKAEDQGKLEKSKEHTQVWGSILQLFDQMVEALGSQELSLEEYAKILEIGLDSLNLGLIPPGLDQVLVNSMDRSRNPHLRAAFVLGLNDGVLPAKVKNDGLLKDGEREHLAAKGLVLAPDSRQRLLEERFLIYTALTRASQRLWLSYPLADEEGTALRPSIVIGRIKELLPQVKLEECSSEPRDLNTDAFQYITHPQRTLAILAAQLREAKAGETINSLWWEVYNYYAQSSLWREKSHQVLRSLFHTNNQNRIPQKSSSALYGNKLKGSISQLEKFSSCPFAHFLAYGLKLKERAVHKLAAPDLGQIFHAALKNFVEKVDNDALDWRNLSREDCRQIVHQVMAELVPKLQDEILLSSAKYRHLTTKLENTILRTAYVLAEHAKRGQFKPFGLEFAFPGEMLPAVVFELGEGWAMELSGRIDRIDLAQQNGQCYLRIIDYKSGYSQLHLDDIYYGLKLQLLAYLDIILSNLKIEEETDFLPAGMFYFSVQNPLISTSGPLPIEKLEEMLLKEFKLKGYVLAKPEVIKLMDGLINQYSDLIPVGLSQDNNIYTNSSILTLEQFQLLRDHLKVTLKQFGQEILGGKIKMEPYRKGNVSACQFCSYKAVCHFDLLLEDNSYRLLKSADKEEIWSKLTGEGEGENE